MNNNLEIIPSPGTDNKEWTDIEEKLEILKLCAATMHIDVVDGKYVPNKTFADPEPFKKYTVDTLFEVHLMVDEPIQYIDAWGRAGFKRFLGHIEKMSDQAAFVAKAHEYGEAVLAIDATTSIHDITVPFESIDGILIMTIHAGFSGQEFLRPLLEKVRHLRRTHVPIEIDGGINEKTIADAKEAGAVRFVATSYLFENHTPQEAIETLKKLIA